MYPILYRRVLLLESTDVSSLDGLHILKYIKCVLTENNVCNVNDFFVAKKSFSLKEGIAFDKPHF